MIKVLHTADWHLGKKLEPCERTEEHQMFLDWLLTVLDQKEIDVLIVAGDIFDSGTPSNTALKQYYDFLWKLKSTCCKQVIVIGGNHDSISTLNAPRELLKYLQVHVVGGVPDSFAEQIIEIQDKGGDIQLVVCAVPFLRDKDVRLSIAGETATEMETRLKKGICEHYRKFTEHIKHYKAAEIPVLATGHLFAQGGSNSDSEKDIHVGNLAQICADDFPLEFDYVALGHLHRPQMVNGKNHIRYSGSPIALSFSESGDNKKVLEIQFEGSKEISVKEHVIPVYRRLLRISGDYDTLVKDLSSLKKTDGTLAAWVEIQVLTKSYIPDIEERLQNHLPDNSGIEKLFIRQTNQRAEVKSDGGYDSVMTLHDLDPQSVFKKKCELLFPGEEHQELVATFSEALELMNQQQQ